VASDFEFRKDKNPRPKEQMRRECLLALCDFYAAGKEITICQPTRSGRIKHYEDSIEWRWGRGYKKEA
jgi:hypothetical protein